jgi:hypothetical protein
MSIPSLLFFLPLVEKYSHGPKEEASKKKINSSSFKVFDSKKKAEPIGHEIALQTYCSRTNAIAFFVNFF